MKAAILCSIFTLAVYAHPHPPMRRAPFSRQNGLDAIKLNSQFQNVRDGGPCDNLKNQDDGCTSDGKFAQCLNGRVITKPCGAGTICAALPLVNSPGTSVTCTTAAERDTRIADTGANDPAAGPPANNAAANPTGNGQNPPQTTTQAAAGANPTNNQQPSQTTTQAAAGANPTNNRQPSQTTTQAAVGANPTNNQQPSQTTTQAAAGANPTNNRQPSQSTTQAGTGTTSGANQNPPQQTPPAAGNNRNAPPPAAGNNKNSPPPAVAAAEDPNPPAAGSGDPQKSRILDPAVIAQGFAQDGQAVPTAGQVASLTSTNNYINFCKDFLPITDGKQIKSGSCSPAPMGRLPSTQNMPAARFRNPTAGSTIKANQVFDIKLATRNLATGNFVNAQSNYFSAPQQLNNQGLIIGHSHVVIERMDQAGNPADPSTFVFFKGVNDPADGQGVLTAQVSPGIPAGFYRLCSMVAAANHQPVIVPVAQRGAPDDCVYFQAA